MYRPTHAAQSCMSGKVETEVNSHFSMPKLGTRYLPQGTVGLKVTEKLDGPQVYVASFLPAKADRKSVV